LGELLPTAELRMVDQYESAHYHGIFWALVDDFGAFESALEMTPFIESWTCLVELPSRRLYDIVVAEAGTMAESITLSRQHHLVWQLMAAHHGRLFVRAIVPSQRYIQAFREAVVDRGFEFRLERILQDVGTALADGSSLTPQQREAIVLAYERGYYRQPRAVSLAELGEELGISESAVSGRLHRGLGVLIGDCLDINHRPGEITGSP